MRLRCSLNLLLRSLLLFAKMLTAKKKKSDCHPTGTAKDISKRFETFELSKKKHPYIPVSTTKILNDFTRDAPPEYPSSALQQRRVELREYGETVEDLRRWAKNRERSNFTKVLLRSVFWQGTKIRMPKGDKLYRTVEHYFPNRMDMKVMICDFGDGRAERQEVCLGDIEKGMRVW